jgi:hypothetical protein
MSSVSFQWFDSVVLALHFLLIFAGLLLECFQLTVFSYSHI